MNKQLIIKIAIFALGAGCGFLVAKKAYEEYYASIAQEEIDSVKEAFEARMSGKTQYAPEDSEGPYASATSESITNPASTLTRSSLDNNPYEKAKRNYNLGGIKSKTGWPVAVHVVEDEDDRIKDAAGMTEDEISPEVDRTAPYIIDDESFTNEFDQHEKVDLYYYRVDDVLCEEDEAVVDDIEGTIGYNALAKLDMQTTVWVRNEPLTIDYQVISLNKSYAETIGGVGLKPAMSPREQYLAKQKARNAREKGES